MREFCGNWMITNKNSILTSHYTIGLDIKVFPTAIKTPSPLDRELVCQFLSYLYISYPFNPSSDVDVLSHVSVKILCRKLN